MNYLVLVGALALATAPAQGAVTKATKESANEALQKWEVCSNELYTLVTDIQGKRQLLPEGAETPEELKAQMAVALPKKDECEKLLAIANAEALRFAEEK